ncbi:MAG: hypothetical protein EHM23_00215 [Acidobacteria bacterium]|nr:MAG: hypothetical protein EHM23_00215 [Acidobacteriota bacterium]
MKDAEVRKIFASELFAACLYEVQCDGVNPDCEYDNPPDGKRCSEDCFCADIVLGKIVVYREALNR